MRYGNQNKHDIKASYQPYSAISKIVGKSITYCREIALDYLNPKEPLKINQGVLSRKQRKNEIAKLEKNTDLT